PVRHEGPDGPLLRAVTDERSALVAIHTLVTQGESDEGTFLRIQASYREEIERDPSFQPARAVARNPRLSNPLGLPGVHVISDPFARQAAELFDGVYRAVIDLMALGFTDEGSPYQIASAMQAAVRGMTHVMTPFANALTQLPAGEGFNAGPVFY